MRKGQTETPQSKGEGCFDYQNKTLVIGLGLSGYASIEFLMAKHCPIEVADSRLNAPNVDKLKQQFPQLQVHLGEIDSTLLERFEQLVVSPGIDIRPEPFASFQAAGKVIIGDVSLFAQELEERNQARQAQAKEPAQVIAITGSNGKSTVTTLVEHLANSAGLKALAGGNLGLPSLSMLDEAKYPDIALYVLELSSFQLETLANLKTKSAVVLNICEDHMDRYEGLEDYRETKEKIYQQCDFPLINWDEAFSIDWFQANQPKTPMGFGLKDLAKVEFGDSLQYRAHLKSDVEGEVVYLDGQKISPLHGLKIKGKHNWANVLASLALLAPFKLAPNELADGLKSYQGLAHRCQWVGEVKGVNYYNDSKGTNVGATLAAVNGFDEKLVLIAGGQGKDADFSPLAENLIVSERVKELIVFGEDGALILEAIKQAQKERIKKQEQGIEKVIGLNCHQVDDLNQAMALCQNLILPGMSVLFSPACASFDQYPNYIRRGEHFVQLVNELC